MKMMPMQICSWTEPLTAYCSWQISSWVTLMNLPMLELDRAKFPTSPTMTWIHSCVQMLGIIGQFVCSGGVGATLHHTCWCFWYCDTPLSIFQIGFMFFLGKRYINAWFMGTHGTCRCISVTASPSNWTKWLEKDNQGGCHMPLHGS